MSQVHEYLNVEVPDNFGEWDTDARVNYLGNAMDTTQLADHLRDKAGVEKREKPQFTKSEMIQIILAIEE